MQFMSQYMSWADNIILAMAPLGIITAIVAAIRVRGPSWLKALIGRARESRAISEAELMSSTSDDVCELWNGQEIVRVMGKGPIREFIILSPVTDQKPTNDSTLKRVFNACITYIPFCHHVTKQDNPSLPQPGSTNNKDNSREVHGSREIKVVQSEGQSEGEREKYLKDNG